MLIPFRKKESEEQDVFNPGEQIQIKNSLFILEKTEGPCLILRYLKHIKNDGAEE